MSHEDEQHQRLLTGEPPSLSPEPLSPAAGGLLDPITGAPAVGSSSSSAGGEVAEEDLRHMSLGAHSALRADPVAYEALSSTWCNSILWFFLDISDSWWVTCFSSIGFSAYAMLLGVTSGFEYSDAITVVMAVTSAASLLLALTSPMLGVLSDTMGNRKTPVLFMAALVVVCVSVLPFYHSLWWAAGFFLGAQVFVQLARLLYDAQVPFVIEPRKRALVQAVGAAVGVLGSCAAVIWSIVVKVIWGPWTVITDSNYHPHTASASSSSSVPPSEISFGGMKPFLIGGAVLYTALTFPYVFHTEKQRSRTESFAVGMRIALGDMKRTFFDVFGDRNGLCCTISWLIIIDAFFSWQAVSSVALSGACGFTSKEFDIVIAVVLPIAFFSALVGGYIINRWGTKAGALITAVAFIINEACLVVSNLEVPGHGVIPRKYAYIGVVANGIGTGFLTCTPRLQVVHLAEPTRVAQWLGLQRICAKITSIASPLLYSAIVKAALSHGFSLNHSWRFVFFLRGGLLIIAFGFMAFGLVDPYRRYLAGERAPYRHLYLKGGNIPSDNLIPRGDDLAGTTPTPEPSGTPSKAD